MNWSRTLRVAGRRLRSFLGSSWRRFICGLFNFRRWILQRRLADYVVFELTVRQSCLAGMHSCRACECR